MSRIKTVTRRDVTDGKRDRDTTPEAPRHRHENRTAIANNILHIAKRVLENVQLGRIYPPGTVQWAEHIVKTNEPAARAHSARARAFSESARFAEEDGR